MSRQKTSAERQESLIPNWMSLNAMQALPSKGKKAERLNSETMVSSSQNPGYLLYIQGFYTTQLYEDYIKPI